MIIERIRVYGFRTLNREVTVPGEDENFSRNINIIAGENEVGKSSLMLALVRALFDDHDTGGQQIERIRPWGTSVSPEVTVEFTVNGTTRRIEKRFLDNTQSRLEVKENGRFAPETDGGDADEKLRELFEGSRSRGASGPSDWGVARALYLRQETGLFEDKDDLSELTGQLGDGEAGIALSPMEEFVLNKIDDRYEQGYFTPTGKYTSKNGTPGEELQEMQKDLDHKRQELAELQEEKQEAETTRRKINKLRDEIEQHEEEIEEYRETIEELEDRLEEVDELREEERELTDRQDDLEKELDELRSDLEDMQALSEQITELEKDLSGVNNRIDARKEEVEEQEEKRSELQNQIEEQKSQLDELNDQLKTARKRKDAIEREDEVKNLDERLETLEELEQKKKKINEILSERPVPDEEDVEELQEITNQLRDRKAELEAVGLSVTISAETEWTVSVGSNREDAEELELTEEEEATEHFNNRVYIEIPGSGRIEVASQANEIQDIAEAIDELEDDRNELLDRFSIEDLEELRTWKEKAISKQDELNDLEDEQENVLGDHSDREELKQTRNEKEHERDRLLDELDEDRANLPETPPDLDEYRSEKEEMQEQLDDLRDQKNEVQEKLEETRDELSEAKENRAEKDQERENKEEALEDLIEKHQTEEQLEEKIEKTKEQLDAVREDLEEIRDELPDEDEDPETRIEDLEAKIDDLDEQIRKDDRKKVGLENELEGYQDEGLSGKINEKREQIEYLENQLETDRSRARGIKFLKKVLDARREERVRDVVQPLQEQTNRYFRRITGRDDRTVILNERLAPESMEVPEEDDPLAFDDRDEHRVLSGGAREQLMLSLRIASARQISGEDEPRFLILDDVLGDTDPDRYDRILDLLNDESEHLQIFLLTSNPDRYRDLENSKEIDLERLKLGLE